MNEQAFGVLEYEDLRALVRRGAQTPMGRARADAPVLWALIADLPRELYALAARTTAKILPSGELDDRASPELARIRHDINRLRSSITRALENLMHRTEEAIQDQLVTVRNERFVI